MIDLGRHVVLSYPVMNFQVAQECPRFSSSSAESLEIRQSQHGLGWLVTLLVTETRGDDFSRDGGCLENFFLRINGKHVHRRTCPSLLEGFDPLGYAWSCCSHPVTTRGDKRRPEDDRMKKWKTPGSWRTPLCCKCSAQAFLL